MTLEQFIADLDDLVDAVCTHAEQNKGSESEQGNSGRRWAGTTSSQE
jgi:hypothetical protein